MLFDFVPWNLLNILITQGWITIQWLAVLFFLRRVFSVTTFPQPDTRRNSLSVLEVETLIGSLRRGLSVHQCSGSEVGVYGSRLLVSEYPQRRKGRMSEKILVVVFESRFRPWLPFRLYPFSNGTYGRGREGGPGGTRTGLDKKNCRQYNRLRVKSTFHIVGGSQSPRQEYGF